MMRLILLILWMSAGLVLETKAAKAQVPTLGLPLACQFGQDCFVQNHVDLDPGPQFRDYACGALGYNGDTGTDFRLINLARMRQGVPVLAAADGVVRAARDGMTDTGIPPEGAAALQGRFAGNSVAITHADGWETQYSHMRQGSVLVQPGQTVKAGQPLGMVGLSGRTEFPHVEMIVRHNGEPVDPFLGIVAKTAGPEACRMPHHGLWSADAARQLTYRPQGLLQAGFAPESADVKKARDGGYDRVSLTDQTTALTFWAELFGPDAGDRIELTLTDAKGQQLAQDIRPVDRHKAVWFGFAGLRRPAQGWQVGDFVGTVRLWRGDREVFAERRTIRLNGSPQ